MDIDPQTDLVKLFFNIVFIQTLIICMVMYFTFDSRYRSIDFRLKNIEDDIKENARELRRRRNEPL